MHKDLKEGRELAMKVMGKNFQADAKTEGRRTPGTFTEGAANEEGMREGGGAGEEAEKEG